MADGDDPVPSDAFGPPGSRYAAVSRRAFLARAASIGAGAAALAACGRDDAAVFSQAGSTTTAPGGLDDDLHVTAVDHHLDPASSASSTTSTAPATTTTAASGDAVHGELVTRFTYAVRSSGGRVNNPYVAVWVEDADGRLVDTIALWYLQSQKGNRWLPELRRWYPASSSTRSQVVSAATRAPGSYSVTWDCTDTSGQAVPAGPYSLCIEAAREHGPYSLIRQSITLGGQPFTVDLPANGELSDASATFTPH